MVCTFSDSVGVAVNDAGVEQMRGMQRGHRSGKDPIKTTLRLPVPEHPVNARAINFRTAHFPFSRTWNHLFPVNTYKNKSFLPLTGESTMPRLNPRNYSSTTGNADSSRSPAPQEQQNSDTHLVRTPGETPLIYAEGSRRGSHPSIARQLSSENLASTENLHRESPQGIAQPGDDSIEGSLPNAAQSRSIHALQSLQRKKGIQAEARETIAQIEEERKEFYYLEPKDLPVLQQLAQKRFEVKEAILDHWIKSDSSLIELQDLCRHMKLGYTADDSRLRQRALNHLVEKDRLFILAKHITDFTPSEKDIPLLVSIGEKIAKDEWSDFPSYLSLLQGTERWPDSMYVNPEYKPLQLPLDDRLNLIKTWLLNSPSQMSNVNGYATPQIYASPYSYAEKNLGDEGLLGLRSTKIPAVMQDLHDLISLRLGPRKEISTWLGYSAAHLIGKDFSVVEQSALKSAYLSLSLNSEQKLLYGGSQIIGKAMQSAPDAGRLFTTLDQFNDKTLGLLFYAATVADTGIPSRFASILNRQNLSSDPELRSAVNNFADFAGSDKIDTQTKQRLLTMFAEAISEASDPVSACTDMMQKLGTIGKEINLELYSKLGRMYQWWLPKCENLEQLNKAAHPDRAFLASLAEMQVIAGESGVYRFLEKLRESDRDYQKPAIPLEPVRFPNSEVLNWVKNAIREWVKTDDANGLLEKAGYVKDSVFDKRNLFDIEEVADNFPELKDIAERADEEDDTQLYLWTRLVGLLMLDTDKSVRESAFIKGMLDNIIKFQGEQSRLPATICLYLSMRDPETTGQLESFSAQFKPKHSKIFAAPLFSLTNNGQLAGELATLMKTVQHHRFRDTKKALPLLAFISEMALSKSLSAEEKCRIVKMLTEEAAGVKTGVTSRMMHILSLAKLADARTNDSEMAIAALKAIRKPVDATAAGKTLLKALFSIPDSEIDAFAGKYEQYLETSRNPTALLSFATSIYMGIKKPEERKEVMDEIALLARGLAANDGGKTLNQIRYSTEGNEHNALLQKKAPLAWERWKEEMQWEKDIEYPADQLVVKVNAANYLKEKIVLDRHVDPGTFPLLELALTDSMSVKDALAQLEGHAESQYKDIEKQLLLAVAPGASKQESAAALGNLPVVLPFPQLSRDINDLKKKLTASPLSLEKWKGLHASISSKPEDLFLIGTEIIGSCQSIHGNPELNKALPGYVLDGKYLSAQVTNENGSLMSRRMLRLLWSEEHNKPVIYVEREYSNPGVPQKLQDACLQLIQEKAGKMGALIATDDEELASDEGVEIGPLQAYRTPRPHEYVDALRGIQKHGEYTIMDAKPMKNVADAAIGNFQKEHYQKLLSMARKHVETLKQLKRENQPPRDFISDTRDNYDSELMIEEMIASENEREPELNLNLCRTANAFARNINELAENGEPGQKARYMTTVRARGFWHVVGYEATVVTPGKIYIRGFDSLPISRSQKYFDAIGDAIEASCQGKNFQIKLDTYATGQQHSPAGCDIFALSFTLKSLDEQFDASAIDFKEGEPFDFQLIADEKAEHLPLAYYKHAQPPEIITQIINNPEPAQDVKKPVNKKEQTLAQRYEDNKTTQEIYSLTAQEYQFKTFSDSIDAKRIVFYERLIQRLEGKVLQY